ncbi:MAG: polysaccharide deacetylase family protein [Gammaproteobacteria bacterium]|nr:polysaccharide deacetylase family protein [Gammaproteobacteria bacterium]
MVLAPLLSLLSPAGTKARLSILIYHRVLPEPDPLLSGDPDAASFRMQMRLLARSFNPLPLAEAVDRLRAGTLPARAACVTFDDGYADNVTQALPILREEGVPATFFIATGYLDGGRMFNDTLIETVRRLPEGEHDLRFAGLGLRRIGSVNDRAALIRDLVARCKYFDARERHEWAERFAGTLGIAPPNDLMMSTTQLRELSQSGMEIGGHTVNHPILARCQAEEARREMRQGKEALERLLNRPVRLFAYPNGRPGKDYLPEHAAMARELGFSAAVSTSWGSASGISDPYQLPRFTPWDRGEFRFGLRLARNLRSPA